MKFSDLATSPYFEDSGNTFEEHGSMRFFVKSGYAAEVNDFLYLMDYIELEESEDGEELSPWVTLSNGESYILPINFTVKIFEVKFIEYL